MAFERHSRSETHARPWDRKIWGIIYPCHVSSERFVDVFDDLARLTLLHKQLLLFDLPRFYEISVDVLFEVFSWRRSF